MHLRSNSKELNYLSYSSSRGGSNELAMHASKVASISSIKSIPHAAVDPFSDSEDDSRHLTSVVSTDSSNICKRLHIAGEWAGVTVY